MKKVGLHKIVQAITSKNGIAENKLKA